jgi:hypothetical protein
MGTAMIYSKNSMSLQGGKDGVILNTAWAIKIAAYGTPVIAPPY